LQSHQHRSEHWVVVRGEAHIVNGDSEIIVLPNQSTYIPAGHKHRLENHTEDDLVMIEVQCGEYLGEDDIIRYEDSYGRT
jgi:mannose-1-phosphate guanylyltransferase